MPFVDVHYPAHRWQFRLHKSRKQDRAIVSGIRGGKTVCGSMEFLNLLMPPVHRDC